MRVLVIQHHPDEGPGILGRHLAEQGADLVYVHAHAGQPVPQEPEGWAGLISLGGPMNVYEEEAHPWLKDENLLLARSARAGLPILGVCLGAQLIAKALGAEVSKAPVAEVGWRTVSLTAQGLADPLFAGMGPELKVLQWHQDTFALPEGGQLLARGDQVAHQAFRWGRAYGLQFHVEATADIVRDWFPEPGLQQEMLAPFALRGPELSAQAGRIFTNFVALLGRR